MAENNDPLRDFFYTFNADGTGEMQDSLMDEPVDLSWEIYDNVLTIYEHTQFSMPVDWDFGVVDDVLYLRGIGHRLAPRFIRRD